MIRQATTNIPNTLINTKYLPNTGSLHAPNHCI